MRRYDDAILLFLAENPFLRKRDQRDAVLQLLFEQLVNMGKRGQAHLVYQQVEAVLYFFQVGFENGGVLIRKKILPLGVNAGNNVMLPAKVDYLTDNPPG